METQKILITGGKGHIGSALYKELDKRGHEIYISDLMHAAEDNYIRVDVGKYSQVERLFEKNHFDFVYHLAAEFGRWNGEDYYENLWQTNVIGTKNIIRLQEKKKFNMIFTSSSEIYGDYSGVMSEEVPTKIPILQMNDYAMTKWVNEMQIINSMSSFGTETVRLRLFNTYGPGEFYSRYRSAICLFIYRALHNLPYTVYTKHQRTSSYIEDTARTIANVVDNFKTGEVYNIAGDELHDMKTASDYILNYLEIEDNIVTYKETEKETTINKLVDASKAKNDLGLKTTINLEDGIKKTINWQKSIYDIN